MKDARILIVEDESIVAKDIESRLKGGGYSVCSIVNSGEKAIKKAQSLKPDLVLLDLVLKGEMSGIDAGAEIRRCMDIPVIFLTAYGDEETLQRAKVAEPYGYILKPYEERELYASIEMALHKHMMESKLKDRERWLSSTLMSIGAAVIALDNNGSVTFMNAAAEALTGWMQEGALGRKLREVFNVVNEKTGKPIKGLEAEIIKGGFVLAQAGDLLLVPKDGKETPIEIVSRSVGDGKGKSTGVILAFRDITRRKQAERELSRENEKLAQYTKERTRQLEKAQNQLLEKENLATVGQLARSLSHELRHPLSVIQNSAYYLRMKLRCLDEKCQKHLNVIKREVERSNEIINDLLTFTSAKAPRRQPVDLNQLARSAVELAGVPKKVKVRLELDAHLPPIPLELRQFSLAVLTLIFNAIQAMPKGGELCIRSKFKKGMVEVAIRDTGRAFPRNALPKLFELPLISEESQTGLGLALVKSIVEAHDGKVAAESRDGQGNTFTFALPVERPT